MNLSQRYETADPTTLQNDCVGRRSDLSSLYKMSISLKPTLLGALCGAFAFGIAPAMAQPGCDPDPYGSSPSSPGGARSSLGSGGSPGLRIPIGRGEHPGRRAGHGSIPFRTTRPGGA